MTRFNLTGQFAFNEDLLYYSELTFKVISTPINILTFFIIYFYSTPDMKDYKIHLLLYQVEKWPIRGVTVTVRLGFS